jgi:LysR family hydrogen peroxide-inducible transcriptional activator
MDIRQLEVVTAIADHGSFSAAARALHTVQSNVSAHVARLERELGATLVDRSTGELTEAGETVVARARRIDAEIEALVSDVASLHAEVAGSVRIGVIGTTARWLLPRLLEAMRDTHPRVHVVAVDATTTSLLPLLVSGQLDLAVVNLPIHDPEVSIEPLFDEDALLLVPTGHPLYERESVSLAELGDYELLLSARGTGFREELDAAAAEVGVTLQAQHEIDGMRLLATLAFQGFGAAILPASAAPGWLGGEWRRIPVHGAPGRSVGLTRRARGLPSAPARALHDVVLEVVASTGVDEPGIHPTVTSTDT